VDPIGLHLTLLVVDDLLSGLNSNDYYATEYADDIAILINGKFPHTVRGLINSPVHSPNLVRKDKPVYQSKQDGNYVFY
jgi:hypothetical protein